MQKLFKLLREDQAQKKQKDTDAENLATDQVEDFIKEVEAEDFIDKLTFIEIMGRYEFDLKKISDQLYDTQYEGIFNKVFCLCCKSRLRK